MLTINGDEYRIRAQALINSAGLWADHIAALAGLDIDERGYRLHPCKGNYFSASPAPNSTIWSILVPQPNHVGLGIHATLDLTGRVRFGPRQPLPGTRPISDTRRTPQSLHGGKNRLRIPWISLNGEAVPE